MSEDNSREQSPENVTVTDKRRIDPETGEVRESSSGPAPSGPAPEEPAADDSQVDPLAELTADLQRVQADFANYRKRALRDQQNIADRAKAAVVTELLGILDDLDRARTHGDLESGPLKAMADKLSGVLTGMGLSAFGAEGDEFDPALHEAVQHEGEGSHSVIGVVLRQGYKLGEQVLRHAMVGVVDTVPGSGTVVDGDTAEDK
ncbi:nucleotide exchange factor GrpE [Mycolicibacter arupensis]|uniref:Protein GrpE n=1 Tax=Mycolicibacter arupensis TaxID=342002 RepID=A0A5C7Y1D8_9MYCO|nr:nucleotide exchange factor GrpE [Mycolicibacter arupensis]MCV7274243.1 nucleotide exchange factor GrpE [Mycolicibacter arupensis]OQZ91628.1 nucleotide exchange factor GrpE [Mycolicibacter arupensis]TXI55421.1 MAG: nucleotide exchange factor GrpE [Mycolicibacter arupensis]